MLTHKRASDRTLAKKQGFYHVTPDSLGLSVMKQDPTYAKHGLQAKKTGNIPFVGTDCALARGWRDAVQGATSDV